MTKQKLLLCDKAKADRDPIYLNEEEMLHDSCESYFINVTKLLGKIRKSSVEEVV